MKFKFLLIFLLGSTFALFPQTDPIKITVLTEDPVSDSKFTFSDPALIDIFSLGESDVISNGLLIDEANPGAVQNAIFPDFSFGSSILLSTDNITYVLPVSYTIPFGNNKQYGLSLKANVPYTFKRKIAYSTKDAVTSGLGDVSVSAGFGIPFAGLFKANLGFTVKLPTGNESARDDGYLVPLGTGSTDYFITGSVSAFRLASFSLNLSGFYRIGGTTERFYEASDTALDVSVSTQEKIKAGTMWGVSLSGALPLGFMTLFASPSFVHLDDGEVETIITNQTISQPPLVQPNPTKADVFDLSLGVAIPWEIDLGITNCATIHTAARVPLNGKSEFSASFNVNFRFKKIF